MHTCTDAWAWCYVKIPGCLGAWVPGCLPACMHVSIYLIIESDLVFNLILLHITDKMHASMSQSSTTIICCCGISSTQRQCERPHLDLLMINPIPSISNTQHCWRPKWIDPRLNHGFVSSSQIRLGKLPEAETLKDLPQERDRFLLVTACIEESWRNRPDG